MQNVQFNVQNIKCGGCVAAVENGLKEMAGVSEVKVTIEGGLVEVSGDGLDRATLGAKLAELGYPEAND
ncbi:MAG: heavy-metal-associated domain-containing protein [Chromatiales bacterium]|nr:heavy-metal-associated domain-containing protein [Chromatiales bacterium]